MKRIKKENGFTLVEILITISLLCIISFVIILGIDNTNTKRKEREWSQTIERIFRQLKLTWS